jgi:hypothetical protein
MDFLLNLLTDPKVLGVLTLPVMCMIVEAYAIYKLFSMYTKLQEQRLAEWQGMVTNYNNLTKDINNTLDLLIKLGGKNGNGTGTK